MYYPVITLLLLSAPPVEPPLLTVKGEPLQEVIASRLVSGDEFLQRKENRPMRPTDKWFRFRFYSRSLVENIQPVFPAGLPGAIPLLKHADSRVRCATLLIIQKWLEETKRSHKSIAATVLSQSDWQRLRLALLDSIANPMLKDISLFAGERVVEIFPRLAKTPITRTEQNLLLQKLRSKEQGHQRQIIQLFLTVKPMRFPATLQAPLRELLENKSTERGRIVLLLQGLDKAPPELEVCLRQLLKRNPYAWPASRLALLLRRSGTQCSEMVPGLIKVFNQEVPPRGGMMGRGAMSFYVPGSPNRWTVLQEKQHASRILMTLPIDQPQVIPELMKMLDADNYETREKGVAAITRFGSGALIALPKLLTMNTTDNRPRGRIQLLGPIGLGPAVIYSVKSIVVSTLIDIHCGRRSRLLISTASLLFDRLAQHPQSGRRSQ